MNMIRHDYKFIQHHIGEMIGNFKPTFLHNLSHLTQLYLRHLFPLRNFS